MVVLVNLAVAKDVRGRKKGLVTRLSNQLCMLLEKSDTHSDKLKKQIYKLDSALIELISSNEDLIDTLHDPRNISTNVNDIYDARKYIESAKSEVYELVERARVMIHELELQEKVDPHDSASNMSFCSSMSSKLGLELKEAQIQAQNEAHKRKSDIRLKQLQLQIESEQIDIDTNLKIVRAEQEIIERVGDVVDQTCLSQILQEGRSGSPHAARTADSVPDSGQVTQVTVTPLTSGGHSIPSSKNVGNPSVKSLRKRSVAQALAKSVSDQSRVYTSTPLQAQTPARKQLGVEFAAPKSSESTSPGEYGRAPSTVYKSAAPPVGQTGKNVDSQSVEDHISLVQGNPDRLSKSRDWYRAETPHDVRSRYLSRDSSGHRYSDREASGSRYTTRDSSGTRYTVKDVTGSMYRDRESSQGHSDVRDSTPYIDIDRTSSMRQHYAPTHTVRADREPEIARSRMQISQQPPLHIPTPLHIPDRDVSHERARVQVRESPPSHRFDREYHTQDRLEMQPYAYLQAMQLPRQHIPVFQDDPLTFLPFLRQFDNVVGNSGISSSAKLSHLIHFTSGRARQLIQPCSLMDPEYGYLRARWLLSERYGDPYRVTQAILAQIRNQRKVPAYDSASLREFSDDLSSHYEILRSLGRLSEITQNELSDIASHLPDNLIGKWRHLAYKIKYEQDSQPNLGDLVKFARGASLELSDPVFGVEKVRSRSRAETQDRSRSRALKQGSGRLVRRYNTQLDSSSEGSELEVFAVKSQVTKGQGQKQSGQSTQQLQSQVSQAQTPSNPTVKACRYCNEQHHILQCSKFRELTVSERRAYAKENQLCYLCLAKGHSVIDCKCSYRCKYCQAKHSQFLHIEAGSHSIGLEPIEGEFTSTESEVDEIACNHAHTVQPEIALPIVPVRVSAEGSQEITTLALLDGGSQATFCSRSLLGRLSVKGEPSEVKLSTLNHAGPQQVEIIGLDVASIDNTESVHIPQVLATEKLKIRNTPVSLQEISKWPHLQDLDEHFYPQYNNLEVELLIGQDMPECLVPLRVYRGSFNEPYVTVSKMGHSLNGPLGVPKESRSRKGQSHQVHHIAQDRESELNEQVERLWQVESIGPASEKSLSQNDKRALDIWEKSVELGADGHYYLDIPFKSDSVSLPNNIEIAKSRLEFTRRKLLRNQDFREKYIKNVTELLENGYAEQVPPAEIGRSDGRVFYLPHHGVVHPEKPDKVRVVYDCSAKCEGYSLNDHVLQGPDLNNNLLGVLLRFRQDRIAVQADIDAMFHQVRAKPHDYDALRFLWWPQGDLNSEPVVHRMVVHLFGGVWSPSVCNFALKRTAKDHPEFPQVVREAVDRNFYVDDLLKSVSTPQEGIDFVQRICELLSLGGFHIAKWVSNSREVLKTIPESDRGKEVKFIDLDSEETLPRERALGCRWNVETDTFEYKIKQRVKPLTKRGILSELSSVYDPQGLVAPYILPAKLIFQELCRKKLGWDEQLPESELASWEKWKGELPSLEEFSVDRCYVPENFGQVTSYQLHHFCDASLKAYGTTSYIRVENSLGQVHCTLLLAKSRLAPLKAVSIPRLELMSATLATRMDKMIKEELEIPLSESQFWTDSMVVLYYIRNMSSRYKIFVANRLAVIHENSRLEQWHHVESAKNPADIASRGASVSKLMSCTMWSRGPDIIYQSANSWIAIPETITVDSQNIETRQQKQIFKADVHSTGLDELLARYSSWSALRRAVAWIKRFTRYIAGSKHSDPLSMQEIKEAEVSIFRLIQKSEFSSEIDQLSGQKKQEVDRSSRLSPLNPIVDSEGLLRIGGRIRHSQLPQSVVHPIVLPNKHPVVEAILREIHILSGHSGSEYVLAQARSKYWILSGRQAVRSICRSCIICRKQSAPLLQQKMADLPSDRVKADDPPFTYTGVDFFGPFLVKRGRSEVKRYGCLFTCLTTRAIHIEVAHTLDVSSFLQCLTRFIARRGRPHTIRSDNGTNFVGGNRELKQAVREWNQTHIDRYLQQRDIQWLFNVPLASNQGGCWERQIRTVRKVLNGLSHLQRVDEETLVTFLTEAESIINGRPLTNVPDSTSDLEALTPNHLLAMRCNALPPGVFCKEDLYSKRRWRQMQYLADIFWKRWLSEYLVQLQTRQKWTKISQNLKVGDLVLLQESTPRNLWPLGKVIEVFTGQDGLARNVRVKTALTELVRPINKLCLLEGI